MSDDRANLKPLIHTLLEAVSALNAEGYSPLHLAAMTSGNGGCLEVLMGAVSFKKERDEDEGQKTVTPDLEVPGGEFERTLLHLAAAHGR